MDEILERLTSRAIEQFGTDRARELKPFLEQTAADLFELSAHSLDPEDEP